MQVSTIPEANEPSCSGVRDSLSSHFCDSHDGGRTTSWPFAGPRTQRRMAAGLDTNPASRKSVSGSGCATGGRLRLWRGRPPSGMAPRGGAASQIGSHVGGVFIL